MAKKKKTPSSDLITPPPSSPTSSPKPLIIRYLTRLKHKAIIIPLTIFAILIITALTGWLLLANRFYPATSIAYIDVSFLTKEEAKQKVALHITRRLEKPLILVSDNNQKQLNITPETLSSTINQTVEQTFDDLHQSKTPRLGTNHTLDVSQNPLLNESLDQLSESLNQPPIDSQLRIDSDQINVTPSQDGTVVDTQKLLVQINDFINTGKLSDNRIPMTVAHPKLSFDTASEIKKRLDQIRLSPLQLIAKDQTFLLDLQTLLSLIDLNNSETHLVSGEINLTPFQISTIRVGDESIADAKLLINKSEAQKYFIELSKKIDRDVQEPLFNFDPNATENSRVTEFKPPVEGQKLQVDQSVDRLSQALLTQYQSKLELPVETIAPKNKLTNEMGIKELIGHGQSNFAGSIENRIFNVGHGARKINGVLIPPGEVFSFNKTVGDISAATGFKQAYVIKSGRTVLDDGGGICQVSTTLFRAVLNAGLPIVTRTAHAYRVGYYEQGYPPGLDATIFYPSVDFQFKNDTPNYILIQTQNYGTSLTIDLYGTSDGRIADVSKPVISSTTPAPPELRQDDPTLPKGTVKQVDWAAAGANVSFKRVVRRNGQELINESFRSNYRPWQAVYLVGTKEG